MEFFRNARAVRLRSSHGEYLVAEDNQKAVTLRRDGSSPTARWDVEFDLNPDSFFCFKSCYGNYLAASKQRSFLGRTGRKVLQYPSDVLDNSLKWKPEREGTHVKLRTYHGNFLRANVGGFPPWHNSVTHDNPHRITTKDWILWNVEVVEREEEGSAPNIDHKALEEGSATKRSYETWEKSSVTTRPPGDLGLIQSGNLVGLDGHKEQLIKLLLDGNSRKEDVLVKGGSGVTALVRKVCEDIRTREHFDAIAWISVPQKYDPELIREEILLQLLFENAPFHDDFEADGLAVDDFKIFSECKGRCLVIVDNLIDQRTQNASYKVRYSAKKCRVIFIARREMGPWKSPLPMDHRQLETYKLEDLSEEEPWAHFRNKFPEGDFPSPLKEVCQLIVRKFESLPAATILHLRNRKGRNIERKSMIFPSFERNDEWAPMILPSYNFPSFKLIRQVLEILYTENRLSCLLVYLSFFPENSRISCKRVSRLWAAEGFVPDLDQADGFLNDLLVRKCIHPVEERSDGELSIFLVDNLVQEIIISLSDHRNLVTTTGQSSTGPESVRYLSVEGTMKYLNEKKGVPLCSIFMLDVSSNKDETTTSKASLMETSQNQSFPFHLELLNVLDLTGAPLQIISDALFERTHLKYLSLRDTSFEEIPRSIGKLTHLEFLDLKHSLVTELPKEVEGLEGIRHILIYHHEKDPLMESYNLIGFQALCSVKGFTCLEKLCFVESDNSILEDLEKLTKLRRLGITKLKKEHGKLLCSSLEKLENLKSLNVHALDEDEIIDLHHLSSPPEFIKHLYLHGRLEELPNWISSLQHLTRIILRWSQLKEDLLATLGELPNLVELELRRAYDGRQLDFKDGKFPKLKILLLEELEGLRSMSLEEGTMPCLENLTISRCQWLERIPSGIKHIRAKKLTFFDMSHEFYEMVRADHEKDNYRSFEHIPEVYFTRWRASFWETHPVPADDGDEGFACEH